MQVRNDHPARFSDEVRSIPLWAAVLSTIGFLGVLVAFIVVLGHDPKAPPPVLRALFGVLVGTIAACYILLVGYINQDARRRGMSRLLWTLVALFVPNGFGIILYFILRKPLPAACPQCGTTVLAGFGFCPNCRYRLQPVCPHCQRGVAQGNVFCPYCGGALTEPVASSPTEQKK
jgi:RNA polymerase subunit RPABC4/transcription elongation factor Spt4